MQKQMFWGKHRDKGNFKGRVNSYKPDIII